MENNSQPYLDLADHLFNGQISEGDVPAAVAQLPSIDEALLDQLAQYAEQVALVEPRHSWTIMQVANDAAHSHECNLFTRSKTAWYLGRAFNHWAQPNSVDLVISTARRGFEDLNEVGWIAACDWQLNVLSWAKTDFNQSVDILKKALAGLKQAGYNHFVPHCQLALAYAQILIRKLDEAQENILASEAIFLAQGDIFNQARCWLNEAGRLRRMSKFDEAINQIEKAHSVFESINASIDIAKAYYQLGLIHLLRTDDLTIATSYLERAADIFAQRDLELWRAACITNLGAIYTQYGRFANAEESLNEARNSFTKHGVLGLLAENLNDSGKLNILKGLPETAIGLFKQSRKLYDELGAKLSVALVTTNLGEAYGQMGRYQDALSHLEQAIENLKPFNDVLRLGTCENFMAFIWWRLGQPLLAHQHLDKATAYYKDAKQFAYVSLVYNFRATLFIEQGDLEKALDCLRDSLKIAQESDIRSHIALAQRLLGEVYLHLERYEEAETCLQQALDDFSAIDMGMEYAATLVSIGAYFTQKPDIKKAKKAFKAALHASKNYFPEIDWRAHVGIARLAEIQSSVKAALREYHKGIEALQKVRFNFWQPALAGSYTKSPSSVYDQAVSLGAKTESARDTLWFIETSKAITLVRQLSTSVNFTGDDNSQELNDLRAEINWLQQQLAISPGTTALARFSIESKQIQLNLIEKIKQYNQYADRLERQGSLSQTVKNIHLEFDLSMVKTVIQCILGKAWIALDYYLTEDQLVTIVLTPNSCRLYHFPISSRIKLALDECLRSRRSRTSPLSTDLNILGNWLIPSSIADLLAPDTFLLISPHRELHGLPWAALQPSFISKPLACACIPNIIPSLHSLIVLYKRHLPNPTVKRENGLAVGVSKFHDRYPELAHVNNEIGLIETKIGPDGKILRNKEATWVNLQSLAKTHNDFVSATGLSSFSWIHIASHAFSDIHTGRLSGLALWDTDIWLDQLRDLAPLPKLAVFSACNSLYSLIHDGDEHIGLPTTCLIAGAESVIGSIWPIQDHISDKFMSLFYDSYLSGQSPAQALVSTQRKIIENGADISHWASFVCLGMPYVNIRPIMRQEYSAKVSQRSSAKVYHLGEGTN